MIKYQNKKPNMNLTEKELDVVFGILQLKNMSLRTTWFCGHSEKRHYTKGICSSCYHNPSKIVNSWLNYHGCKTYRHMTDRTHRAKCMCSNCYTQFKRVCRQKKS